MVRVSLLLATYHSYITFLNHNADVLYNADLVYNAAPFNDTELLFKCHPM